MNNISKTIVKLRKENNMSQEDLANKLNVSRQAVSKWEREECLPDIENINAMAKLFSVSIDSLVNGTEEEIKSTKDTNSKNRILSDNWKDATPLVAVVLFFIIGFVFNGWPYSWLAFLLIPIVYTLFK